MKKEFTVKALYKPTNRKRTETFIVKNEVELRELLKNSAFVEPFEISEVFDEPTDAQLEYAKALKIKIPQNASLKDVSALISRAVDGDSEPNPELIEFADNRGFFFSQYIGKKALYNLIFNNLSGKDKIAFFLFAVYRSISDDRKGNLDKHKHKELFYEFAEKQMTDEKFVKSLEKYTGEDIRFFGNLKFTDGGEYVGGSVNTIAYKTCANFLKEKLALTTNKTKKVKSKYSSSSGKELEKNVKGCFSSIAITVFIIIALYTTFCS